MELLIARQPIFDRNQQVFAYELLYREAGTTRFNEIDGDKASLAVIRNALMVFGAQSATGGKKAFINFTRNLLIARAAFYLPKEMAVIEILEDVEVDEELIAACRDIRQKGYALALDDFVLPVGDRKPLLPLVDYIKVDYRLNSLQQRRYVASGLRSKGRWKLLAEKTETLEEFQEALDLGYDYFQGYFFCKAHILARKDVPGYKLNYLQVLQELNRPEIDIEALQKVIERDPSLTFRILKYVNSAFFGLRREVSSIRQTLLLLGEKEVQRWASLVVLFELGKDRPEELLRTALVRARLCENLSAVGHFESRKAELFLLGMLSLVDVMLGRPMEEILEDMPLSAMMKETLVSGTGGYSRLLSLVLAYEQADWYGVALLASELGLQNESIAEMYAESVSWAENAFNI